MGELLLSKSVGVFDNSSKGKRVWQVFGAFSSGEISYVGDPFGPLYINRG